jgi:ATP-binding cassette subfamily B protein
MNIWRAAGRVGVWRRHESVVGGLKWSVFFTAALLSGIAFSRFFDALSGGSSSVYLWAGATLAVEIGRRTLIHGGALQWNHAWVAMEQLLRTNMLAGQVASGGDEAAVPVRDPGEALSRFRDDPQDIAWFVDNWVDLFGAAVMTGGALAIMAAVDWRVSAVVLLPVGLVAGSARFVAPYVRDARRDDLAAASGVTGVLRDVFSARDLVVAHGAVDDVVAAVAERCEVRRGAAVRNRVMAEAVRSTTRGAGELAIGLVLVVIAGGMRSGAIDVGDLALFTAYITYLTMFPRMMAMTLTRKGQAEVAVGRMSELVADGSVERLVRHREFAFDSIDEPPMTVRPLATPPALRRMDVADLRVDRAEGGLSGIDFTLHAGTMTVVTGPVGSGKSTLVRALLGLLPSTASVHWDGELVVDRAAFFIPPRAAYLAQVPQLFSAPLGENVALGRAVDHDAVEAVIALVAMDDELADMPQGIATEIGARGIRLSGGQRQRVAAARSLATSPALLVVDDISSALDIETELLLWRRLRDRGVTVLATSTRPVALEMADQVLTLDAGRLVHGHR